MLLAFRRLFMLFIIEWKGSKVQESSIKSVDDANKHQTRSFKSVNVKILNLFKALFFLWKFTKFVVTAEYYLIKINAQPFYKPHYLKFQ